MPQITLVSSEDTVAIHNDLMKGFINPHAGKVAQTISELKNIAFSPGRASTERRLDSVGDCKNLQVECLSSLIEKYIPVVQLGKSAVEAFDSSVRLPFGYSANDASAIVAEKVSNSVLVPRLLSSAEKAHSISRSGSRSLHA